MNVSLVWLLESVAQSFLLNGLMQTTVRGSAVLLVVGAVALAAQRLSAAHRHLFWMVGIVAMLAMPIAMLAVPQWRVLPPSPLSMTPSDRQRVAQGDSALPTDHISSITHVAKSDGGSSAGNDGGDHELDDGMVASSFHGTANPTAVVVPPATSTIWRLSWTRCAEFIWLAVSSVLLLRIVVSRTSLGRLARQADFRDAGPLRNELNSVAETLGCRQQLVLCVSPRRRLPMTWGILQAYVLLPARSATWSRSQLRAVFLHELAHVRRRDPLTHVIGQIVCAVYWFNPLVWFAAWRAEVEREQACDDVVVGQGVKASDYAESLLEILTSVSRHDQPFLAVGMGRPSRLGKRLMTILDERQDRRPVACSVWRTVALSITALTFAMATLQARSVETDLTSSSENDSSETEAESNQLRRTQFAGVCRDTDGSPIVAAKVFLFRGDRRDGSQLLIRESTSDREGRFRFERVPTVKRDEFGSPLQTYWLIAQIEGRATAMAGRNSTGEFVELTMGAAATVEGRVTGAGGEPVEGAVVRFEHFSQPIEGVLSATTGPDGRFAVTDLTEYDVENHIEELDGGRLMVPRPQFKVQHPDYADQRVDYKTIPNTIDVTLELAGIVEGRVVFADTERPAADVVVQAQGVHPTVGWRNVKSDAEGRYRLTNLAAGAYNVWAVRDGWTVEALASFRVASGLTAQAPDLSFVRGGFVKGHLINVATRKIATIEPNERTAVGLHGPSRPQPGAAIESTAVQGDGSFEIRVAPGRNMLYLTNPGPWEVQEPKSISVDIAAGETAEIEFFVLRSGAGRDDDVERIQVAKRRWEAEQPAVAAITTLGGWVKTAPVEVHFENVIEVNMVYHHTEAGERLDNRNTSNEGLFYVPKFTQLKKLLLHGEQANDVSLQHIQGMEHLTRIFMWDAVQVTDAGVLHLTTLPSLKQLHLSNSQITDKSLELLGQMKQLERLSLQGNRFTDAGLAHLRALKQLRSLAVDLGPTHITDEGAGHLATLTKLESLMIQNTEVTDVGLRRLEGLANLKRLDITGTQVTSAGIEHFREAIPECEIYMGASPIP